MKKILSLALVLVMTAALFTAFVPASAAGKDPAYAAKDSKVIAATFMKAAATGNTPGVFDGSYAGDNLNPCEGVEGYGNSKTAQLLGATCWYKADTRYTAYSEKGADVSETAVYNTVLQLTLGNAGETTATSTKVSSVTIAVPGAASKVAECAPNGFTIYYSDSLLWMSTTDNDATKVNMNKANFKYSCTVSDLVTGNKYVDSADGSFRYYECNLPEAITAKYIIVLFSNEFDTQLVVDKKEAGIAPTAYAYMTEFAVFSDEILIADDAGTTEHRHIDEDATTEDVTTAEVTTAEVTTAAATTEAVTTAEVTTAEVTTAEVTTAEEITTAEETKVPVTDAPVTEEEKESGCGSSVAVSALVLCLGGAALTLRKKHD